MFQSQNLDLRLLGGLELEITLAPDSNVFSNAGATERYLFNNVHLASLITFTNLSLFKIR